MEHNSYFELILQENIKEYMFFDVSYKGNIILGSKLEK